MNILLAEDEDSTRAVVAHVLLRAGHTITAVADGNQALAAAQIDIFDLAVVDYGMPGPNGLELLVQLRRLQPHCLRVLVSGALDVHSTLDAINRGEASRVLSKPFDRETLLAAIDGALATRDRLAAQSTQSATREHARESTDLAAALAGDGLRLAVQPIVDAGTGAVVACEALLRCKVGSLDSPIKVIEAAERRGLIPMLSAAVVARAAELMARLPSHMRLLMNTHPTELDDPDALLQRLSPLAGHARRIVIEITERSRMSDAAVWRRAAEQMREAGFAVAVDDIGAGYSSLSVLAELQPEVMKIDMSIIRDCHRDVHKRRLVELLCNFARAENAILVAEGIETREEAETVTACGAHWLQGYFYGKPAIRDEFADWSAD